MLVHEGFVVLEPSDESELDGAARVAPCALLHHLRHLRLVARVEGRPIGEDRLAPEPRCPHRDGVQMAAHQFDVVDAVAAPEERHQRGGEIRRGDPLLVEQGSHTHGLPPRQRGPEQPQRAKSDQQARETPHDFVVALEDQIQRPAAPGGLE